MVDFYHVGIQHASFWGSKNPSVEPQAMDAELKRVPAVKPIKRLEEVSEGRSTPILSR